MKRRFPGLHQASQPAEVPDDIDARSDEQMIGIPENNLRIQLTQLARTHCFHAALCPYWDKGWRVDDAMRGR